MPIKGGGGVGLFRADLYADGSERKWSVINTAIVYSIADDALPNPAKCSICAPVISSYTINAVRSVRIPAGNARPSSPPFTA